MPVLLSACRFGFAALFLSQVYTSNCMEVGKVGVGRTFELGALYDPVWLQFWWGKNSDQLESSLLH